MDLVKLFALPQLGFPISGCTHFYIVCTFTSPILSLSYYDFIFKQVEVIQVVFIVYIHNKVSKLHLHIL